MRDLIEGAYAEKLSLDMLASHANISKFHALRAFKQAMGVTPHEYQVFIRVGRAKQMLRAGLSSTEVAHTLGFWDQSHFVRTFQQMVLITPGQHQTGIRAGSRQQIGPNPQTSPFRKGYHRRDRSIQSLPVASPS